MATNSDATAEGRAVFHVHDVSKTYHMGEIDIPALRSVSLDLYPREFILLLGASGSGKSTLLNTLGGLDRPTSGQVFYLDHDLTAASSAALTQFRREHGGFVFQFYNLIPSLTALENVASVTEIASNPLGPLEALTRVAGLTAAPGSCPAVSVTGQNRSVSPRCLFPSSGR